MYPITSSEPAPLPDTLYPYVPAVARFLGMSRSTADRLRVSGEARVVRFGRRVMIRESEIVRIIERAEAETKRRMGRV